MKLSGMWGIMQIVDNILPNIIIIMLPDSGCLIVE